MSEISSQEEFIKDYINKLMVNREYLVARYLLETGHHISDICLVERRTDEGSIFYPDLKSNYPIETEGGLK